LGSIRGIDRRHRQEERLATKKAVQLRVHQLAKELGVNSKDIVSKCHAEGIEDIENHLSPVSAGLAATVREWFGTAPSHSAVETAPPVAVETRAKAAPKRGRSTRSGNEADGSGDGGDSGDRPNVSQVAATLDPDDAPSADGRRESVGATEVLTEPKSALKSAPVARTPSAVDGTESQERVAPSAPAPSRTAAPSSERAGHDAGTLAASGPSSGAPLGPRSEATAPASPPTPRDAERFAAADAVAPSSPVAAGDPVSQAPGSMVAEPETDEPISDAPTRPLHKATAVEHRPHEPRRPEGGAERPGRPPEPPRDRPQITERAQFVPVMNVPVRPDNVKPVGPMLDTPEKISMAGPRVIRVEAAESLPTPRARSGPGAGGPGSRPGGGGAGAGAAGPRRNDRRRDGQSPGRSGRAFAPNETPFEPWRPQDLVERDKRLEKSSGFIRSHRRDVRRPMSGGRQSGPLRPEGPFRVSEPITVKELSEATGVKVVDILKRLLLSGTMATINSAIDSEKAIDVMLDLNIELEIVPQQSMEEQIATRFETRETVDVQPRSPVVTILGHVDHGKTSLLDKIRNTNVASGEAGGITQKTSAFQVPVKAGDHNRVVTFIDTPGHEAFTGMRSRGAKVTDIVVLVVAADDGVMPQTVESINHAKAAGVPIVVALNKIDKPEATEANITRVLGQLAANGLNPTEWGGSVEVIRTSATKGTGIQDLLDILDYQAELLGITAGHGGHARGTVLEARTEEGRGAVANLLVQEGTLRKGNFIVIGRAFGRVRDIINDRGQRVDFATPATPVAISGIDGLPDAGDKFFVVDSVKAAEEAAEERRQAERQRELAAPRVTLDNIFEHLQKGQRKELALVLKTDVHGSLETLRALVGKMSNDEVTVSIKHSAIGGITEADVVLAETTGAIVIGFNVTTSGKVRQIAEEKGVEIRLYEIIYNITDDLRKAIAGMLEPEQKLEVLGHADVRQVFRITKVGSVAGCYVTDGVIERNAQIRVTRDGIVVEKDRRLEQLRRFKEDVREVRAGQECGMKISGYDDIREGDVLECYKTVSVAREA
jgi:translation initiation factor IF-2